MVLCWVAHLGHVVVCPGRPMYRKQLEYKLDHWVSKGGTSIGKEE